jgi:hypothetical protein
MLDSLDSPTRHKEEAQTEAGHLKDGESVPNAELHFGLPDPTGPYTKRRRPVPTHSLAPATVAKRPGGCSGHMTRQRKDGHSKGERGTLPN